MKQLVRYLAPHKTAFVLALLFLFLVDAVQLFIPLVIGGAVDRMVASPELASFWQAGLLLLALGLAIFVLRFTWRYLLVVMAHRIERDLRARMYERMLWFSDRFYAAHEIGDLMARAVNDMKAVRQMFSFGIVSFFDMIVLGLAALGFMAHISWRLTWIAVLPLPLLTLVVVFFENRIHDTFTKVQAKYSQVSTFVQEAVAGIFLLKAFRREEAERVRFASKAEEFVNENLKLAQLNALFDPMLVLVIGLSTVLVLLFGGREVMAGHLGVGQLVAFLSYLNTLAWPVMAMGFAVTSYQRGTASLKRIEEVTERPIDVIDAPFAQDLPLAQGLSVSIKNLSFAYGDGPLILENLSLDIPAGKTVGVLGRIGSGKSTLVRVLARLVQVPPNTVFFNGVDICNIRLVSLRENVSYVPQEPFLFSTTIRENIAFAHDELSFAEVRRCAAVADIDQAIMDFPAQYDTIVGERGVNLSGGQKQRLTIARAVAKASPLFIFDDSFSSIDTDTEEKIIGNLHEAMSGRSTIMVTHRVSTVRHADWIIFLENGTIAEQGSHSELLALRGRYFELYERQRLEEKLARE